MKQESHIWAGMWSAAHHPHLHFALQVSTLSNRPYNSQKIIFLHTAFLQSYVTFHIGGSLRLLRICLSVMPSVYCGGSYPFVGLISQLSSLDVSQILPLFSLLTFHLLPTSVYSLCLSCLSVPPLSPLWLPLWQTELLVPSLHFFVIHFTYIPFP